MDPSHFIKPAGFIKSQKRKGENPPRQGWPSRRRMLNCSVYTTENAKRRKKYRINDWGDTHQGKSVAPAHLVLNETILQDGRSIFDFRDAKGPVGRVDGCSVVQLPREGNGCSYVELISRGQTSSRS